eukprot:ANDGO_05850.mRNA.1 hypothetical protein
MQHHLHSIPLIFIFVTLCVTFLGSFVLHVAVDAHRRSAFLQRPSDNAPTRTTPIDGGSKPVIPDAGVSKKNASDNWDPSVSAKRFADLIRPLSHEFELIRHIVSKNRVGDQREIVFGVVAVGRDITFNWIMQVERAGYKNWLLVVRHQALFEEIERLYPGHTIMGLQMMDKLHLGKCGDEYDDHIDLEQNGANFSGIIETVVNYMLLRLNYIVIYANVDVVFRGSVDLTHIVNNTDMAFSTYDYPYYGPMPRTLDVLRKLASGVSANWGFFVLFPTKRTIIYWREYALVLLLHERVCNDQLYGISLLNQHPEWVCSYGYADSSTDVIEYSGAKLHPDWCVRIRTLDTLKYPIYAGYVSGLASDAIAIHMTNYYLAPKTHGLRSLDLFDIDKTKEGMKHFQRRVLTYDYKCGNNLAERYAAAKKATTLALSLERDLILPMFPCKEISQHFDFPLLAKFNRTWCPYELYLSPTAFVHGLYPVDILEDNFLQRGAAYEEMKDVHMFESPTMDVDLLKKVTNHVLELGCLVNAQLSNVPRSVSDILLDYDEQMKRSDDSRGSILVRLDPF